jgi:hypothetical protein
LHRKYRKKNRLSAQNLLSLQKFGPDKMSINLEQYENIPVTHAVLLEKLHDHRLPNDKISAIEKALCDLICY